MREIHQNFMEWTKRYDEGGVSGRTREKQEKWLSELNCQVLRIESVIPPHEIAGKILAFMEK